MTHPAQANDEETGTSIFQADDASLDYLARLLESREIEFETTGREPRSA